MSVNVNAEIIAIGTEILLGEITDTNSVFLARALRDLGVNLYFMTTVGDNRARIAEAVRMALTRADVVITCGGLGPTVDDMTRDGVADATGHPLVFNQALLDQIAERFSGFRAQMTDNNRQQAYVPEGAIIVENAVGTAPSFIVESDNGVVLSLPGVPREMKYLFNEKIAPYLRARFSLGQTVIAVRVLKTAGVGESMLDAVLGSDLLEADNPTIGLAAHAGQVDIRITAKSGDGATASAMLDAMEARVRERVNEHIYGVDDESLEQVILTELIRQNSALTVYEIGVPPLVSERLHATSRDFLDRVSTHRYESVVDAPASPSAQSGSLRSYAEMIAETEGQGRGPVIVLVSREDGDGDHADAAEISAIAVSCAGQIRSRSYGFSGGSDTARQFMGTWSLSMLWRLLVEVHAG